MKEIEDRVQLAEIKKDVNYIIREVSEIKALIADKYVTMDEFLPIKNIVYGVVGLILVASVGAILKLVFV